ncbi:tetratricopeptide repeat protein [Kordia sp. TARA_039_SRF]|nr:tetratricopeptide repeat protein [Kordia sp. TARA_039_SRF]
MDDIGKRLAIYTQNIENGIDLSKNYFQRGNVFYAIKQYNLALKDFDKVISLDKNNLWAYNNRALAYLFLGEFDLSLRDFNHIIALNKKSKGFYANRALLYNYMEQSKLCILDYNKAESLGYKNIDMYYNRGLSYHNLKLYKSALKEYNQCLNINRNYFNAYLERGKTYIRMGSYRLALKDIDYFIENQPNNSDAYNTRGLTYYYLKKYEIALIDLDKAIKLNKEGRHAYMNIAAVYYDLDKIINVKFNCELYLYYSFKEKRIKFNPILIEIWEYDIYNFIFLLENFTVDFDSFLFVNNKNKIQLIQPIENYNSFLSVSNSDKRIQESQRAILNYYLGSPVAAYILYDEVLDVKYYPLTAQELYYYGLTADILKLDQEDILEDAIEKLLFREDKSVKDWYYLGQLHLLNNDEQTAITCFQNSHDFVPSFIMLMSFEENTAIQEQHSEKLQKLDQDVLIKYFTGYPKTAIKTEYSFETQFEHYFYATELFTAVSKIKEKYQLPEYLLGYTHLKMWEAFYLSDVEEAIIDKALRNHKIQQLINTITQDLDVKLVSIDGHDKTNYLEKIKHSLREDQDLDIREAFDSLLETLRNNGNVENHLGQMIEAFRLEKAQLYLYFISYFYLQGNLNSYQTFVLFSYLIDIVSTKRSKAIKESIQLLIPEKIREQFLTTLGLSKHFYDLIHVYKAYNIFFEDYNEYQLQKESKYITFKNNFNAYISMNKETLSEEMFTKKFQCFPAILDHNLERI